MVEYPEKMLKDKNAWLWKPIYKRMMTKRQQFSSCVLGRPGSGKSYLAAAVAETFYPDIEISESVFFTPRDFANKVAEKLPRSFPLVLDDAGLSIHSTEALSKEIRAISKTLQSIRHRSLCVFLTVPSFNLLASSTRVLSDYLFEPLRIDYRAGETITKFHRIKFDTINGNLYRSNPIRMYKKFNEITGFTEPVAEKVLNIRIPKASKKVCRAYDKFKRERMLEFDEENAANLEREHTKKVTKSLSNKQIVDRVHRSRDKFVKNNEISTELIMFEFNLSKYKAQNIKKLYDATKNI